MGEKAPFSQTQTAKSSFHPILSRPRTRPAPADAFIGSFAVFIAEGMPEREALARANLYAGLSTMNIGTQKSFIKRSRFNREWRSRNR